MKRIKLTPILVLTLPITLISIGCGQEIDLENSVAYEFAMEMTMINHLDYDKIINQDLEGDIEKLTLENIEIEMANEPNIIDYYLRKYPNATTNDWFPIDHDDYAPTNYNKLVIEDNTLFLEMAPNMGWGKSWSIDEEPSIILEKGLSWVFSDAQPTKFGSDLYYWTIKMTKEIEIKPKS